MAFPASRRGSKKYQQTDLTMSTIIYSPRIDSKRPNFDFRRKNSWNFYI